MTASRRNRSSQNRTSARHKRHSWRFRLTLVFGAVVLLALALAVSARQFAPRLNTSLTHFDAIIVLGTSADKDGNPTPDMLARVTEAVHEYEKGVAPRLIVTGGGVHNRFTEAQVMQRAAQAQGIPASAIVLEPRARDTIQNACYSVSIMQAHGWRSAEVVSRPEHLPRAAMIFSRMPIEWTTHPAPSLRPNSVFSSDQATAFEILKTVRYLLWARWSEDCLP
jgi:uncharacterized SAM-binding protein YcdF (DUF218 family)